MVNALAALRDARDMADFGLIPETENDCVAHGPQAFWGIEAARAAASRRNSRRQSPSFPEIPAFGETHGTTRDALGRTVSWPGAAMRWLRRYLDEKEPTLMEFAKVGRSLESRTVDD